MLLILTLDKCGGYATKATRKLGKEMLSIVRIQIALFLPTIWHCAFYGFANWICNLWNEVADTKSNLFKEYLPYSIATKYICLQSANWIYAGACNPLLRLKLRLTDLILLHESTFSKNINFINLNRVFVEGWIYSCSNIHKKPESAKIQLI